MPRIKPVQTKINHWYLLVSFIGNFLFIIAGTELIKLLFNSIDESYMPLWLILLSILSGVTIQYYGLMNRAMTKILTHTRMIIWRAPSDQ